MKNRPTLLLLLLLGPSFLLAESRCLYPGFEKADEPANWQDKVFLTEFGNGEDVFIDPVIPKDWTWLAVKGASFAGETFNFFFWQGIVFSQSWDVDKSTFRVSKYPHDLTPAVESDAHVIAMMRQREAVALVVSPHDGAVSVRFDEEVMGEPMHFHLDMEAGEARLIRFFVNQAPFRP